MRLDLTNRRFGRLLVQCEGEQRGHGRYWRCACDCGKAALVRGDHLTGGRIQSCGCLSAELTTTRNATHGHARATTVGQSPTYRSWADMVKRTTNPRTRRWADYGGRGITVCDRWRDFAAFLADMGERPPGRTLDRINNDGNYEPGNCRWATPSEQAFNRRPRKAAAA